MQSEHEAAVFSEYYDLLNKTVCRMFSWHNDKDNLVGVGSVSLLKAVRSFDPDRGCPFWGYAKKIIVRDICNYVNNEEKLEHYIDDNILASRD